MIKVSQGLQVKIVKVFIFISQIRLLLEPKLDKISQYNFSAEDGILIGNKKYWGMGLSKKVYKLLLLHAFNDLNLRKIIGGCNENNLPMVKTFQSLGYQLEGRLRKVDFIDDNFSDHFYFGIFKEEFFKHNKC